MSNLQFKPTWVGTLAMLVCIPLFIHLGMWQYSKAEKKQALQAQYNANNDEVLQGIPAELGDLDALRYKQVLVQGEYLPQYQILLDNQVEGETAGYHVITPLQLADKAEVVLVDRGWIPASDNHSDLPKVEIPANAQKVLGQVWVPSQKFYTLAAPEAAKQEWQVLWQNMDMATYAKSVPFKVVPFVLRMSPSNDGGFVRNWIRPDDRIETHLSYAYQWFGFAAATLAIYLFVGFRRRS